MKTSSCPLGDHQTEHSGTGLDEGDDGNRKEVFIPRPLSPRIPWRKRPVHHEAGRAIGVNLGNQRRCPERILNLVFGIRRRIPRAPEPRGGLRRMTQRARNGCRPWQIALSHDQYDDVFHWFGDSKVTLQSPFRQRCSGRYRDQKRREGLRFPVSRCSMRHAARSSWRQAARQEYISSGDVVLGESWKMLTPLSSGIFHRNHAGLSFEPGLLRCSWRMSRASLRKTESSPMFTARSPMRSSERATKIRCSRFSDRSPEFSKRRLSCATTSL